MNGSGLEGQGSGDHTRPIVLRDLSKGPSEEDELGHYHQDVFGFVHEVDEDFTGLATRARGAIPQPRNWLIHESDKPILGTTGLYRRLASVALIADDLHKYSFELNPEDSPLADDWSADQRSTRIVDYNPDDPEGRGHAALLSQLVKVVDDHTQKYAPAIVLGPTHPALEGGTVGAGLIYDDGAHGPYNGLLSSVFTTNPSDTDGSGLDGTPYGLLGIRHDAHFELEDGTHHGRVRFEATELDGYSEPAGWPFRFKSEMRSDTSTANTRSTNKHEHNEWRPFYEAMGFVPEIPHITIEEGPGVPVLPPDDPGVPIPGGGTGVTLALPLMDPEAPNPPPSDDSFGYLGMATNGDGEIRLYISQGGESEWLSLCELCCEDCGGEEDDGGSLFYGDAEDDGEYV